MSKSGTVMPQSAQCTHVRHAGEFDCVATSLTSPQWVRVHPNELESCFLMGRADARLGHKDARVARGDARVGCYRA